HVQRKTVLLSSGLETGRALTPQQVFEALQSDTALRFPVQRREVDVALERGYGKLPGDLRRALIARMTHGSGANGDGHGSVSWKDFLAGRVRATDLRHVEKESVIRYYLQGMKDPARICDDLNAFLQEPTRPDVVTRALAE